MELSLTPELERFVHQQVKSGRFASPNEVVVAAIRSYEDLEQVYQGRYETLRDEISQGLEASLRGDVLDEVEVFDRLRHKIDQRRSQAE